MEAIRTVPFIIATKEGLPLFAAVDPVGRCRRAVEKIEMEGKKEIKLVKYEELSSAFGNASRKETVIFADYILDDMTLEFAAEKLFWDVTENGIAFLTFRSKTAPIFIAGKDALHKLAALDLKTSEDPVSAVEEFCEKDPEISVNRHELERAYWSKLTDRRSAKKAQWGLLKYLQFRPGGLVAKYLNRPVSIRMSRILVNFSFVTPNFVTVADFFLGLIAVALFFFPGWEWAVAAGITIHLNSIIDGVDGEIARMRHQGSALGAWLDSICDETLGALIYLGIGYHLYVTPPAYLAGKPDLNIWFLAVGAFTAAASYTYALIHWHCKRKHGLGFYFWWECYKPRKEVQRSTSVFSYMKKLFWRDSILLIVMLAAIFNFLDIFLVFSCIPATVNFLLLFIHIFIKRARW